MHRLRAALRSDLALEIAVAVVIVPVLAIVLSAGQRIDTAASQAAPVMPPVLTDVVKLQLQNAAQRMEIAQLKAQAAQADYDRARADLVALVKANQFDGYTLDLGAMKYTKNPDPAPKK